jgi:hypothetical protein
MIFVLYAGPVASLFPEFRQRAAAQAATNYVRIRSARKATYRFTELLRMVRNLFIEHPELEGFAKNVILLRKQRDLRAFLLTQPDFVRTLAGRTDEIDLYRSLGVPLPDPDELLAELPEKPIQRPQVDPGTAIGDDGVPGAPNGQIEG